MTRKKQIIRYSCLALALLCGLFLCVSSVFAATRQSLTCSTTVSYDPAIKAVVQVSVDGGTSYSVVFNNTGGGTQPNSTYFTTNVAGGADSATSTTPIKFKVTNHSNQPISATVRLATDDDNLPDSFVIPKNVYLYDKDNIDVSTEVTISNRIAKYENSTATSGESQEFYIQTLFTNTIVPLVVELKTVS